MNRFLKAILLAAATYAVRRYLARSAGYKKPIKPQVETWENEGGALAPQHARLETSQVPR